MKRRMNALQDIGQRLAKLSPEDLGRMELPGDLLNALIEFQSMTKHEARRRQMQYIGRVMRGLDTEQVLEALTAVEQAHDSATADFHFVEELRDRLVAGEDEAMAQAMELIPPLERGELVGKLRSLVKSAQKERAADKPPKQFRALFRLLRDLSERVEYPDG